MLRTSVARVLEQHIIAGGSGLSAKNLRQIAKDVEAGVDHHRGHARG